MSVITAPPPIRGAEVRAAAHTSADGARQKIEKELGVGEATDRASRPKSPSLTFYAEQAVRAFRCARIV